MANFVEMDDIVKFKEQIEEKAIDGQVVLINKFNVKPDKVEQFLKDWGKMLLTLKNSQDLFLHNCIKVLARVQYSLITQFGNH